MSAGKMPYGLQALVAHKREALRTFQVSEQLADKFWTFEAPFSLEDAKALVDEVNVTHPARCKLQAERVINARAAMAELSDTVSFTRDCLGFLLHETHWGLPHEPNNQSKDVTVSKQRVCDAAERHWEFVWHVMTRRASPKHHATNLSDFKKLHEAALDLKDTLYNTRMAWRNSDAASLFKPLFSGEGMEDDDDTQAEINMMLSSPALAQKGYGYVLEFEEQVRAFSDKMWDLRVSGTICEGFCKQTA